MHFDSGTALIKSTNRGFSMRKAIALVLLIVLGTMPLQTSAQVSVPAVDLQCENSITENGSSEGTLPMIWIDTWIEPERDNNSNSWEPVYHERTINCTVTNPNTYSQRIQIQPYASGLTVSYPGAIDLGPNTEEAFNVTVSVSRYQQGVYQLTMTAKVVEANGAPPPNIAESQIIGEIHLSTGWKEYGPDGCATFAENGYHIIYDHYTMTIEHRLPWDRAGPEPGNWLEMNTHDVTLRLNRTTSPLHAANFGTLVTMGCYNDMPFHRVIDGFIIQSGDFETGQGSGGNAAFWAGYCNGQTADQNGTNYTAHTCPTSDWSLPSEHTNGLRHGAGSLAAAHAGLNTDGSQFYIVPSDSDPCWLDGDQEAAPNGGGCVENNNKDCSSQSCHTVFGEVAKGMHFIDYISDVSTGLNDRPIHDVIVTQITFSGGTDTDSDGLPDGVDDYPNDANETEDSDGDGVGDNSDPFPYDPTQYGGDSDGDGTPDVIDDFPNDANETTDSDGDGVGDNSDAFPDDANETHDDDGDGLGNNSDAFPQDSDETHDDDGDGVGNNTDEFPQDPDEQFDDDDDGVGNNADDFPDNAFASNWSTIYAAVGVLLILLVGAGVMISRMKKQDELPNVPASNELEQLEKEIAELEKRKSEILGQQDLTESMFDD